MEDTTKETTAAKKPATFKTIRGVKVDESHDVTHHRDEEENVDTIFDHTTLIETVIDKRGRMTVTRHAVCKYLWGRFNPVGSSSDQEIVKAWHSGVGRQWKRGELVIVPSTYLNVTQNANVDRFKMVPGKPEKKLAPYNGYGFSIDMTQGKNGEATEQEYIEQLQKGTEHNKGVLAKQQAAAQSGDSAGA